MKVKSLNCVRLLVTPWTEAYQAPPSMGFSRQEYWSGVPLPSWKTKHTYALFSVNSFSEYIHPTELSVSVCQKMYIKMYITALFIVAKTGNNLYVINNNL